MPNLYYISIHASEPASEPSTESPDEECLFATDCPLPSAEEHE